MDTHSMNYHYEEHFPSFEHNEFLNMEDSEGNMGLSTGEDIWEWEVERELNGDIALIPVSGDISMDYLSNSPPVQEDFQKILNDWHHFIDDNIGDNLDYNEIECFDKKPVINNNINRSTGKKIDMSAQCYIVENEPIAVKMEALEVDEESLEDPCPEYSLKEMHDDFVKNRVDSESDYIDVDTISEHGAPPILQAGDVDSLLEQFEATEQNQIELCEQTNCSSNSSDSNSQTDTEKRKEILNALPEELIKRIKASSQRRIVPVIDPIPNKKRSKKIVTEILNIPEATPIKVEALPAVSKNIQLDHDYCVTGNTPYPKYPKKDSGFESSEEDEQRNILRNQPTVKDANGRLMVSLLKVNTLQSGGNSTAKDFNKDIEKRKLNLEEYKKRRKDVLSSSENSKHNSPTNSGSSSPTIIEDEKSRLLKHQQKLQQMAAEVLKTPPRSKVITSATNAVLPNVSAIPPPTPLLPENIEVKVLVSIGVNTDEVAELKEIRPILKNAIDKIDSNSLITSVIESIQIKKEKKVKEVTPSTNEHGEDKTIVYLDKCRPPVSTRDIFVQVDMVFPEDEVIQKRGRTSIEHRKCYKRRSSSSESNNSYSSESSSSSRSRSRSPTTYRAYKRNKLSMEKERLREVEERRIIYIGGIGPKTTKDDLRKRFQQFGPITNTSIHFRDYGRDNYGFVTFAYTLDAYKAIEHGNDDPTLPQYDLSFGGRRIFCGSSYSDLDNVHEYTGYTGSQQEDSFDNLLREAQAKLRKRKSCA